MGCGAEGGKEGGESRIGVGKRGVTCVGEGERGEGQGEEREWRVEEGAEGVKGERAKGYKNARLA